MPFRYYLRVRYIECDAQKVVFNSRYGEYVDVSITTSFTIGTDFRIAGDEKVIVTAETVYVLVDAGTLAKRTLPEGLRAAFEEGAAGRTTDHAGRQREK